jgi:Fe-S-cluster containining protein
VRADIYALGATLYHLTTGSLPFEGRTSEEVLAKQVLESLSGERIRALGLSPQLHYFLEKMMAKDPEMRFQDPKQLQREVEAFLQQQRLQRELEEQQQRDKPKLGGARSPLGRRGGCSTGGAGAVGGERGGSQPGYPFRLARAVAPATVARSRAAFVRVTAERGRDRRPLLGLSEEAFRERYLQPDGVRLKDGFGNRCVFLQDGAEAGCAIYTVRPAKCREWPFWPEVLRDPELLRLVQRTCPGIEPLDPAGRLDPA